MEASQVAQFLQDNPGFFDAHAELLGSLSLPHPHGGGAISLTERQLLGLRDKIRQLEAKLAEMITFGEENDEIGTRVHLLSLDLLDAPDYPAVLAALFASLQEAFAVPYTTLRLWDTSVSGPEPVFQPVSEELRLLAADLIGPYCGAPVSDEVQSWFGADQAAHVRSVALVPLRREARLVGLLAMGSPEPERFYPEMGTLYVERIGELLTRALLRYLG